MKSLINYLYYQIATLFYKDEGDDSSRAITFLSVLETIIIISPINYLIKIFIVGANTSDNYLLIFLITFFLFMIPLTMFNYYKFRGAYYDLKNDFETLTKSKKIIYDILLISIIVIIGLYFYLFTKNLH